MALPLIVRMQQRGFEQYSILKVVDGAEFVKHGWAPAESALLIDPADPGQARIANVGWGALVAKTRDFPSDPLRALWGPQPVEAINVGDVLEVRPGASTVRVLYRRGDRGNVIFATEQCNSYCLMCSQPPRALDDSWRTEQNLKLIALIDKDEPSLAITGGEPTLLGPHLVDLIRCCKEQLPNTDLQILTNGRSFARGELARSAAAVGHPMLQWNVPLYADVASVHDYIVQAAGAFDETLSGLYRLAASNLNVEIRVVLHRQSIPRLEALANFIYRNLSFVRHIALMGLEPIGFTRANKEALWIDPIDYQDELKRATEFLHQRGMQVSIYNLPLCVLSKTLWPFAKQSISDWKTVYLPACERCSEKDRCGGFFASTDQQWTSRGIQPFGSVAGGTR